MKTEIIGVLLIGIGLLFVACCGRGIADGEDNGLQIGPNGDDYDNGEDPKAIGSLVGVFQNTYYIVAYEGDFSGPPEVHLFDSSCNSIATVSTGFADSACMQGSARLSDGRVINYHQRCSCGGPCSFCWAVLDSEEFPWGKGSRGNSLEPLRSWAVDNAIMDFGTVLYVEEWDGLEIPAIDGLGGGVHDGCFRADDVGGAIKGNKVDIFAGSRRMWLEMESFFPTHSEFKVYENSERCSGL